MNITQNNNYADAVNQDFTMFATLGGFQDSFKMDFAAMFLQTNYSKKMEQNLIQQGIAHSCIEVYIKPNSRPNDYTWAIIDNGHVIEGDV